MENTYIKSVFASIIILTLFLLCAPAYAERPSFKKLRDTPQSYVGEGGNCVTVKDDETGLEFSSCGAGGGAPTDAEYWVGTADGDLSEAIVVNSPATLQSAANLGTYAPDILAATSEADFKSIVNLEAGTDFLAPSGDGVSLTNVMHDLTDDGSPQLSASLDLNGQTVTDATGVNDDDCTGQIGTYWWDSTDNAWEFCNADSGAPTAVGSGSGTVDTSGTPVANDIARFTDADTIAGVSYAELWATAGYLSAALAELDDEDWVFTGDVDVSGANSFTTGLLTFADTDGSPASVGVFRYDNTITNIDDGGLVWYDDDQVKLFIDMPQSVASACTDDYVVSYDAALDQFYCKADADTGGATAYDDIGDPDAAGSISFDDGETATYDGANEDESFITISLNKADLTADTEALLITAVDNDDANYIPFLIQDDQDGTPDDLFKVDYAGDITNSGDINVGGAVVLTDNNSLQMDGTPDGMDDDEYNGVTISGADCGENLTQWDTVFINNDADIWHQADATAASSEYPAHGLAVAACTDTNPATILTQGIVRNEGWTGLTVGGAVYLGETDGALTQTAPSTSNDCVQIIGWAISDSEIYFDFSRPYQLVE